MKSIDGNRICLRWVADMEPLRMQSADAAEHQRALLGLGKPTQGESRATASDASDYRRLCCRGMLAILDTGPTTAIQGASVSLCSLHRRRGRRARDRKGARIEPPGRPRGRAAAPRRLAEDARGQAGDALEPSAAPAGDGRGPCLG